MSKRLAVSNSAQDLRQVDVARPLAGISVLETGGGYSIKLAGRILADLGATVYANDTKASASLSSAGQPLIDHLGTGKADLGGRERPAGADVDIAITDQLRTELEARHATVTLTPFGRTGPKAPYQATELTLYHATGLGSVTPRPDPAEKSQTVNGEPRPIYCSAELISGYTALHAASASLVALYGAMRTGSPLDIDISQQEAVLPMLRREFVVYHYTGNVAGRKEGGWQVAPAGIRRAKDGYVRITIIEDSQWRSLASLIGRADWLDDRYSGQQARIERSEELYEGIDAWLAQTTIAEVFTACQAVGVTIAPVYNARDLVTCEALWEVGFFTRKSERAIQINSPIMVGGKRLTPRSEPPAGTPGAGNERAGNSRPRAPQGQRELPLAGVRVIDFGHVWAGPYAAQLLAHAGAEVIKVESSRRIDVHRRMTPYAEGIADINRAGVWNAQNSGKKSITLNISTEKGVEVIKRLLMIADVALDNFSVGVMDRLGLGWADMQAINRRLVYASIKGFGESGPYRNFKSYGPTIEASGGIAALTGYRHGQPRSMGGGIPDTAAALYAVTGIMAGLVQREKTGQGCLISVSQWESTLSLLPGSLLDWAVEGRLQERLGNQHSAFSPHGVYACAGVDRWIAIACETEAHWEALCDELATRCATTNGSREWRDRKGILRGKRLGTASQLDELIEDATRPCEAQELESALQARGVPASVCLNVADLLADQHLRYRKAFALVEHPVAGTELLYAGPWKYSNRERDVPSAAPVLGADNSYVFHDLLGMSEGEISDLHEQGVIR